MSRSSVYLHKKEEKISEIFKALSHPWSIKIYEILKENSESNRCLFVRQIAEELYKWNHEPVNEQIDKKRLLSYCGKVSDFLDRLEKAEIVKSIYKHEDGSHGKPRRYVSLRKLDMQLNDLISNFL